VKRDRRSKKSILIIGAGNGGTALLELLANKSDITITGVVDKDEAARGMVLAKQLNISTGRNAHDFLKKKTDIIINLTGKKDVEEDLLRTKAPGTEIIGGSSARMMFNLVMETKTAREQAVFQAAIIAQVRNAVVVADLKGRIQYWNRYAEEMFQWESAEVAGKPFFPLILPKNKQTESEELLSGILFEGFWEGEIVAQKKDGALFPLSMSNSVLRDDRAQSISLVSISSDITQLKKAEEAFTTEASFRKAIEDAVRPGIVAYDTEGRQLYVNQGFCNIVGWRDEELVGTHPPFPYWPAEELTHNTALFEAMLRGTEGIGMIEMTFLRRDGGKFHAMVLTAPFYDEYGNVKGLVSSISDITEYKRKEEWLNNSREQLRDLASHLEMVRESERKETAHRIHDEIGQPLAALKLELASLSHKLKDEQTALSERAGVMNDIIDESIQAVKRLCTDLRPWLLDDMGIAEAIKWQLMDFGKRTSIEYELTTDLKEVSLGHDLSTTIFRIFQEMLRNIELHAGATRVSVTFSKKQDRIVMEVKDNGVGIAEELIHNPKSYGLSSIRERVFAWDGAVDIGGEPQKGTTITVNLPLKGRNDPKCWTCQ
jgi:PAS domain S-box-containing protein